MANPITWRNVNGPNFGAANLLAAQGANSVTNGIRGLADTAGQIEQSQKEQAASETQAMTDRLMASINSQNDIGRYENFERVMREQIANSPKADASALYAALDSREDALQQDKVNDQRFNAFQQEQASADELAGIRQFIGTGQLDKARTGLDNNTRLSRSQQANMETLLHEANKIKAKQERDYSKITAADMLSGLRMDSVNGADSPQDAIKRFKDSVSNTNGNFSNSDIEQSFKDIRELFKQTNQLTPEQKAQREAIRKTQLADLEALYKQQLADNDQQYRLGNLRYSANMEMPEQSIEQVALDIASNENTTFLVDPHNVSFSDLEEDINTVLSRYTKKAPEGEDKAVWDALSEFLGDNGNRSIIEHAKHNALNRLIGVEGFDFKQGKPFQRAFEDELKQALEDLNQGKAHRNQQSKLAADYLRAYQGILRER